MLFGFLFVLYISDRQGVLFKQKV